MAIDRIQGLMLGTADPYNETEAVEVSVTGGVRRRRWVIWGSGESKEKYGFMVCLVCLMCV